MHLSGTIFSPTFQALVGMWCLSVSFSSRTDHPISFILAGYIAEDPRKCRADSEEVWMSSSREHEKIMPFMHRRQSVITLGLGPLIDVTGSGRSTGSPGEQVAAENLTHDHLKCRWYFRQMQCCALESLQTGNSLSL